MFVAVLLAAGPVDEGDAHPARIVLRDRGDLGVGPKFRAGVPFQVGTQQGLEFGLVEHVGLRVTVIAFGWVAPKLGQHAEVLVEQTQPPRGP